MQTQSLEQNKEKNTPPIYFPFNMGIERANQLVLAILAESAVCTGLDSQLLLPILNLARKYCMQ